MRADAPGQTGLHTPPASLCSQEGGEGIPELGLMGPAPQPRLAQTGLALPPLPESYSQGLGKGKNESRLSQTPLEKFLDHQDGLTGVRGLLALTGSSADVTGEW